MQSHSSRFAVAFASLLCAAVLSGCGASETRVAGVYDLDRDALRAAAQADIDAARSSGEIDDFVAGMAMTMFDSLSMTLTLNDNGGASMEMQAMGEPDAATGSWSRSGETITITLASPGKRPESATGTADGQTILLRMPEADRVGFDLVFRRRQS